MVYFIIFCVLGLLYQIFHLLELFFNITFLTEYANKISTLHENLKDGISTKAEEEIYFLSQNLDKYHTLVNTKTISNYSNDWLIDMLLKNLPLFCNQDSFIRSEFTNYCYAIHNDTLVAIGKFKQELKREFIKLIPIFYISNFFSMLVRYLFFAFPFSINSTFRSFITFFAEICGILGFIIPFYPKIKSVFEIITSFKFWNFFTFPQ